MRYEDDFGSFWMVDDNEFVKRRHLSRGRPRKYETSPTSPEGGKESIDQIQMQCSNSSQAISSDKLASAESNIGAAMNYGSPSNSSSSTNFGNEGDVLKSGNNNNNIAQ